MIAKDYFGKGLILLQLRPTGFKTR